MERQIRFCTTPDGARLAYSISGQGPGLVIPPGWVSHLELSWGGPILSAFWEKIARHHTVVTYDKRGAGLSGLTQLGAEDRPHLCLVDEIDAKAHEAWPYAALLPCLDAAVAKGIPCVFVLAGSSGSSVAEMKERMAARPKGADLLSRIPVWNEYEIPQMSLGDRALVVLTQFRQVGREMGREIQSVEKLGLYYIILNSRLTSARQLRELAVRAVERMPASEDRVKYDHLFGAGDPENKEFWLKALPAAKDLANRFVTLED